MSATARDIPGANLDETEESGVAEIPEHKLDEEAEGGGVDELSDADLAEASDDDAAQA